MASNPCIDAAKAVGGEDLTDRQLEEILSVLDVKAARALREEPGIDQRTAYQKAAAELQAERKLEILIAKRQRAINVAAKQKRERFYERAQAEGMPLDKAIQAQLVGTEGPFTGAGNSVDAMAHGLEDSALVGPMIAELDAAGLMDVARLKDPDFESRVAHEMARMNGDATIPATKDQYAAKMAEIFVKYTERGRHLQNSAGAFIRKMPGYITRQMHDQVEIYRAGKQAWVEKIKPLLHPRVFDGVADVDKFLGQTWRNLASGNHEKVGGGSDWLGGFEGPGNLAKRASAERVLHFKNPAAWLEYNTMFGRKSLFESVLGNLHYAARNTAIMRTWGTNPEAAFKADIKQFKQQARDSDDIAAVHALDAPSLRWAFDELNGGTQIKGNPTLAMWGGAFRTGINMASLGGVVLSSIPDAAVRASVLRHNGMPLTEAWRETLDAAFHALQLPEEKTRAAKMLNVGVQGMIGGIFNRFSAVDNAPGTMVKANQTFFKYTLLTAWTDGWSRWMGITLANHMGNLAADGKAFADIDTLHQTTLRRYGIGGIEWDILRNAEVFDADGAGLLMPDKVRDMPLETMDQHPEVRARIDEIYAQEAEMLRRQKEADDQDAEWFANRLAKFDEKQSAIQTKLAEFRSLRESRVGDAREVADAYIQRLEAEMEQAAVRTDIAAFLRTEKDRGRVVDFLYEVEGGKAANRLEPMIARRVEMFGKARSALGETLGQRMGNASRRMVEAEARVKAVKRTADREVLAFEKQMSEKLDRAASDVAEFSARMYDRITARFDRVVAYQQNIGRYVDQARAGMREDLATKLSTYYADQVRESLTMGGARERSLLGMGLSRGTVAGEMARIVMQFKQFPLTFMTKHLNREINRGGKLDKGGIGHLMAATTALGFVSLYVGALAKGQTVQQPEDAKGYAGLMAQSMIKGGSAGLLGDAIFSSAEGGYQRLAGNLLGPGIGKTVGPVSDILAAAADGRDPSAKALKAVVGLIPYNNLFYTRLALDHMFLHGLQETVNPGYLRRYERFVEREQNREWWLPPTSAMNQ